MSESLLPKNWNKMLLRSQWEWMMVNYPGEDEEGIYCVPDDAPEEIKEEFRKMKKTEEDNIALGYYDD